MSRFQKAFAGAALIAWVLAASYADGQVFRRRTVPVQPTTPAVATQPAVQPNAVAPQAAVQANATVGAAQGEVRMLHGSNLIGMTIASANHQPLGVVKDFIVDYQGDCPTIFFAVAPQIAGFNNEYMIVPFNAFQVGFDQQRRTEFFTLNMTAQELTRAPRLAVNGWTTIQDVRPFASSQQFYQRVERNALKPQVGNEANPALPRGTQQDPRLQQPNNPQQVNPQQPNLQQPNPQQPQAPQQTNPQQPRQQDRQQPPEQPPAGQQPSEKQPEPPVKQAGPDRGSEDNREPNK